MEATIILRLTFTDGKMNVNIAKTKSPDMGMSELVMSTIVVEAVDKAVHEIKLPKTKEDFAIVLDKLTKEMEAQEEKQKPNIILPASRIIKPGGNS